MIPTAKLHELFERAAETESGWVTLDARELTALVVQANDAHNLCATIQHITKQLRREDDSITDREWCHHWADALEETLKRLGFPPPPSE